MESSPESKPPSQRTPRKRAVRGSVDREPEKTRKRPVESPRPEVVVPVEVENRKAPTSIEADRSRVKKRKKTRIIFFSLIAIGFLASAGVGSLDKGGIDVQKTIEARNERIRSNNPDERDVINSTVEVPVQNTSRKVDGGLIGVDPSSLPPVPEPDTSASSTASSTIETTENSSSTEAVE